MTNKDEPLKILLTARRKAAIREWLNHIARSSPPVDECPDAITEENIETDKQSPKTP